MKRTIFSLLLLLGGGLAARSQAPERVGSAEIYLRLKKLNVLGTVLYVAAHPDDENSGLIAYMEKDRLYRTGYLSMTRGDGGQNLIGDEQGVELGLIRTQEMLAARRVDGADQFFTRAYDFGFSKSTEEALRTWGEEKILSDVVWVIRRYEPDVIITRFPPDSRAGHGHHSASAVLAHEAFVAAADPSRFPEQFKYGVKPWQAKRLVWNTFRFGATNTTSEDQVKVDMGVYNPILGKSYGEIAAESRTNHKSQGAALIPRRGAADEYFTLVAGEPMQHDPMDGVNTSWQRVEGGEKIAAMVDRLIDAFSLEHPDRSVPGLVTVYKAISGLEDGYWKTEKLKEVRRLIDECSGLWLEAVTTNPYAVQGDSLGVTVVLNNRLNAPVSIKEITVAGLDTVWRQELEADKNYSFSRKIYVSPAKPVTQPYWLEEEMSPGSFNVKDQRLIGDPQGPPAYEAIFRLTVGGEDMEFTRPVQYKFTDQVKGELYEPVTVIPPVTAQFDPELVLFGDGEEKRFRAEASDHNGHGIPKMALTPTPELTVGAPVIEPSGAAWTARPVAARGTAVIGTDLLFDRGGQMDTALELKTISYEHIPRIDYFKRAREKIVLADLRTSGHRIGYIEGAGDKVPEALQQMGYEVVMLKEKDLTPDYLAQFDAVVAGVRAYDVHGWLIARHSELMAYVKDGGNLIVQYNRGNLGRMTTNIGPYPLAVANIRVTDENSPVNFLQPSHPVLNYPNKITNKDFDGWIQERGIYFAGETDPAYEAVLSMNDPGEQAQKGSLVIAHYGKGIFVYTGLDFFRELPAGVPGAYRLMANIIALNHKKGF